MGRTRPCGDLPAHNETIRRAFQSKLTAEDLAAIGITNQRETTVVWNPKTGEPSYNAIVWQDTRTDRIISELEQRIGAGDMIRSQGGLPSRDLFLRRQNSVDSRQRRRRRARPPTRGEAVFGNIDTWVIWNLTGGTTAALHVTDVTNASRTMLMDLADA